LARLINADDVYDCLPAQIPIQNLREFAGILAFDNFTCQADCERWPELRFEIKAGYLRRLG
jgi:hypothetical protein